MGSPTATTNSSLPPEHPATSVADGVHTRGPKDEQLERAGTGVSPAPPAPTCESLPAASTETQIDWDTTLAHAKSGYSNAQEVIRFVDTKTGVMTGLVSITTAAPVAFFQWSAGIDEKLAANILNVFKDHRIAAEVLFYGFLIGMALGAGSILCSVHGLMARNTRRKESHQGLLGFAKRFIAWIKGNKPGDVAQIHFAYLFPLYLARQEDQARTFFSRLDQGLTKKEIAQEHGQQLFQVGRILNTKISQNQKAVAFFKLQVICYAVAILAAVLLFRYGH